MGTQRRVSPARANTACTGTSRMNSKFRNSGSLAWFPKSFRAFRPTRQLFTLAFAFQSDFVASEGSIRGHKPVHDNRLMHLEVLRLACFAYTILSFSGPLPTCLLYSATDLDMVLPSVPLSRPYISSVIGLQLS